MNISYHHILMHIIIKMYTIVCSSFIDNKRESGALTVEKDILYQCFDLRLFMYLLYL